MIVMIRAWSRIELGFAKVKDMKALFESLA
jgi:hypothetical protein